MCNMLAQPVKQGDYQMVNDVTSDELNTIIEESKVVFVDCHAVWCGPCKTLSPIMEELSDKYGDKGVKVVKLDVDQNRQFSMENQISTLGTPVIWFSMLTRTDNSAWRTRSLEFQAYWYTQRARELSLTTAVAERWTSL